MDDLIKQISEKAGITLDQARKSLETLTAFLKDKLPPDLFDQLGKALGGLGDMADDAAKTAGKTADDATNVADDAAKTVSKAASDVADAVGGILNTAKDAVSGVSGQKS